MNNLVRIKYNEQWKVWVATDGRVYYDRKNGLLVEFSRSLTNSGYYQIGVPKDGKPSARLVHRLVAETFLENPNNLRDVDHINNIKTDNRLENLRFATHSFNCVRRNHHMSPEHKKKITAAVIEYHKGKVWYTDGVKNVYGTPDVCPEGFHKGFTKSKHGQGHYNIKPAREFSHEEKIA